MKTMRQICAAALTLALVVAASGCNTEDISDTARTLPDKQDGKLPHHAATARPPPAWLTKTAPQVRTAN